MEAALFTLDVILLITLLVLVKRADKNPDRATKSLGLFSYLEHKTDAIQKGLGRHKERPRAVTVSYIDGPMKHLSNEWHFAPLAGGGCRVDFMVDFAFRSRVFETLAGQMFDKALRKMIAAFEARAGELYAALPS